MTGPVEAGEKKDDERALELIETGAEFGGAAVGGALGLIGGPAGVLFGAAGGVAATRVLVRVGAEIHQRLLSPRQQARVGGALGIALLEVRRRVDEGDRLREDGFLAEGEAGSDAEELAEGVLLQAMNAHEQRKVPILGRMLAGFDFEEDLSPAEAHFLVRSMERLSYRQIVCLSLFGGRPPPEKVSHVVTPDGTTFPEPLQADLVAELRDLGNAGLAGFRQDDGSVSNPNDTWPDEHPGTGWRLRGHLTAAGQTLFRLGQLEKLPPEDRHAVWAELHGA